MNDQSNGQKLFLTRLRRHRITVLISRVLILTVFLFLWELCARFEIPLSSAVLQKSLFVFWKC